MGITLNQLKNAIAKTKEYTLNKFTHENIEVLEKLSVDENNTLLFNGEKTTKEYTEEEIINAINELW